MNTLARDLLRAAAERRQSQAFGAWRRDGTLSAVGVLGFLDAGSQQAIQHNDELLLRYELAGAYLVRCPACSVQDIAMRLLIHLNDDHRFTFAQIAEVMP